MAIIRWKSFYKIDELFDELTHVANKTVGTAIIFYHK